MREDIAKWVEALRSGEYKQCDGTLHNLDTNGFCCLGVYARVVGIEGNESMGVSVNEYGAPIGEGPDEVYNKIRNVLPVSIVETGINMNDSGRSFAEIADMIEKYYTEEEADA